MSSVAGRVLPADPASRAASLSVGLNAVLMVLKLTVGVISGSIAVLSDGIDSLEDLLAATLALASVRYGARPPDATHQYGHGRAETLAASFQGLLIGGGGVFIIVRAILRILDPPREIGADLGIVAMLIAAAANFVLVQYTRRVARQTGSPAIASEARHLWTNVVQAATVTLGLVVVLATGKVVFDGAIALFLGAYLLWTGGGILWTSTGDILDSSLKEEEVAKIRDAIGAGGLVAHDFHGLRTRRSGQVRHIDFHLALPAEMQIGEAHAVSDEIEARIQRLFPGSVVTVHVDPMEGPAAGAGL